jgi:dihydroorotase (multifunctional complex type)
VWVDGGLREAAILIDQAGKISELLSPAQAAGYAVDEVIDAAGSVVLPGGIDMHAHLQDGAETFFQGTCAAAAGGLTTVVDMPPFHACTGLSGCLRRQELARLECVIDYCLGGGIVVSLDDLDDLDEVASFGSPYFKVFMPADPPVDTALLWACVQAAAHTGLRLALHAEEAAAIAPIVDWKDPLGFPRSRPPVAEASAVALALEMARAAGAPIHICHVSLGRTAELIDAYRGWGTDLTAETTPHYLLLDEGEFLRKAVRVKTTPPLRSKEDCELLWQALAGGVIDALVSDHYLGELPQPGTSPGSLQEVEAGIAGLELSLPLLYHAGVGAGRLSLARFVQVTAANPAHILGISDRKGAIQPSLDADLVFLEARPWVVAPLGPFSRIPTTPYQGRELSCRVGRTLLRGETVWDGASILAHPGYGQYIPSGVI